MTERPIRSVAGHVLATGEATDDEAKSLAAAVLADDSLTPSAPIGGDDSSMEWTREDLERILSRIDGQEGQRERADAIRQTLANMGAD